MKRAIVPAITMVFVAALVALFVFGISSQGDSRALDNALASGRHPAAPESTLAMPVLDGSGARALTAWRGKILVVNFFASWCPPCQDEAALLEKAQLHQIAPAGGTILGVTWRDASPDSQAFVQSHGLTYPVVRDVTGSFAKAYGTSALPETFFLDRDQHVVAISRGELTQSFITHALTLAQRA